MQMLACPENKIRAMVLFLITVLFGFAGSLGMVLMYGLGVGALHALTVVLEKDWPGVDTAEPRRRPVSRAVQRFVL